MKVLLTGGAGFIGSNFVNNFANGEYPKIEQIVVLDKLTYAGKIENITKALTNPSVSFVHGDICDKQLVHSLLEDLDTVINFAAESHVDRSIQNPSDFVVTNVLGTQTLLQAALEKKVKRFLQVSTDEVYGSISEGSWDESFPLHPNSPYSATKASADLITLSYFSTYGLGTIITRCSNNYGPKQNDEKLIPNFILKILAGKNVTLYGDGSNIRDWLHVEDHCRGIYIALTSGGNGEIYNIGGGIELSNLEVTRRILTLLKQEENKIDFVQDRLGHDFRYSVNWEKISKLGYVPRVSFSQGLVDLVDEYVGSFPQR